MLFVVISVRTVWNRLKRKYSDSLQVIRCCQFNLQNHYNLRVFSNAEVLEPFECHPQLRSHLYFILIELLYSVYFTSVVESYTYYIKLFSIQYNIKF